MAVCLGLLGIVSAPALAGARHHGHWNGYVKPAPAKVNAELAVCPGQTFSQPFLAFEDDGYYTLVEGSEFDEGAAGWSLRNGAAVVDGTGPDSSSGSVLELPAGAFAISPPVCVTLQYPTARAWVRTVEGDGGVAVGVYYAKARNGVAAADYVGRLGSAREGEWDLSDPFAVEPELGGAEEGVREVRFVYANLTRSSVFDLAGLYVDPRMR